MRRSVVMFCLLAILLTACGIKLPDDIGLPTELTGSEARTLEAATAAAQEKSDRISSGDYAGAWLLSSNRLHAAISQADYTTFQETCSTNRDRLPVIVTGVRMDGDDRAIVREKDPLSVQDSITMVYEDGKWVAEAADYFVEHTEWSAERLIAERRAAGKCGGDGLTPPAEWPSSTSLPTTPAPAPEEMCQGPIECNRGNDSGLVPGAGSCSVDVPGCEGYEECHPVVTGNMDCSAEDESCSKPGNNFPWCVPSATAAESTPVVENCSLPPQVKPELIILICDNTWAVKDMVWTNWTVDAGATGQGTEVLVECVPNCAQGAANYSLVTVTLTGAAPPDYRYTSAVITNQNTGKSTTAPVG